MVSARLCAALALACLLATGTQAAPKPPAPCDPSAAVFALAGLATEIGYVSCKAGPGVNLTAAFAGLSGTISALTREQAKSLPATLNVLIGAPTSAVQPFLTLSVSQLENLLPLLSQVPAPVLAGTFQTLAAGPPGTLDKMLLLITKVPKSNLEQLTPLFESLTPQLQGLMVRALRTIPPSAMAALMQKVQAAGPLLNVLGVKASMAPSVRIRKAGSGQGASDAASPPDTEKMADAFYKARDSKCPNTTVCSEETAVLKGLDVATAFASSQFGDVACRIGTDVLLPSLNATLQILKRQCPQVLTELPTLVGSLSGVDPQVYKLFFSIPTATLRQLVPVLAQLPPSATAAIPTLGKTSPQDVEKLVLFTTKVSYGSLVSSIKLLQGLSTQEVETMAGLLAGANSGTITLTLRLLDKFGFALDGVGAALGGSSGAAAAPAASTGKAVVLKPFSLGALPLPFAKGKH